MTDTPEHIWWKWYPLDDGTTDWMIICTAHTWTHLAQAPQEVALGMPQYDGPAPSMVKEEEDGNTADGV